MSLRCGVLTDRRTNGSVTKDFSYTYNLDGSLAAMVYPTSPARTITYSYDSAARLISAVDSANGINYATAAKYSPAGGLCSLKNGASITSTFTFTNRLQPNRLHVTTTGAPVTPCAAPAQNANILDFTYAFNHGTANNGNVAQIANNLNTARTQNFTYDELNRIKTATTQAISGTYAWGLTFGYDPWANLLSASVTQGNPPMLNVGVSTKNQINTSGFVYDAAGNLITVPPPVPATYTYDAENRMTTTAGVSYFYDGDGKRVKKDQASGSTYDKLYWYGMSADPMLESDLSGNVTDEYIFFGGKRIARRQSSGTIHYYFADHLGSSRVVTSTAGAILEDSDYYPFGGERVVVDTTNNNYKFTGKERDSESGLDFFIARYYSSGYGRFVSTDRFSPITDIEEDEEDDERTEFRKFVSEPVHWNKYAYSRNNPLVFVDPDGEIPVAIVPILYGVALVASSPAGQRTIQLTAQVAARYGSAVGRIAVTQGNAISTQLFSLGNAVRGGAIEILRGAPQAFRNFPVIDKFGFANGLATSIKSFDTLAKSYQTAGAIISRLGAYVDKLVAFSGGRTPGVVVQAGQVTRRVLEVILPKGPLTAQQRQALQQVAKDAAKRGVEVRYLVAQ